MADTVNPLALSTTVTATLTDQSGQLWISAFITIIFFPTPSTPGPYIWQGGDFTQMYNLMSDANGAFSITLPDNMTIAPSGSMWQFIISPSATMPAVVFSISLAGPSKDISDIFTSQSSQLQNTLVQSISIPRAYKNAEVAIPPYEGQLYFDTKLKSYKVWYNNMWNPVGGGSGGSGCIGSAGQILWLPSNNQCGGDPLFIEQGNPAGSTGGGLHYTGNGAYFDAEQGGSYYFTANDPTNSVGTSLAQFNLTSGGTNAATFGVRVDTSGGSGSEANAGNINLYTTGNSTNGNNIFITAVTNPLKGGSGRIVIESYGQLLMKTDYNDIIIQSGDPVGGITLVSGNSPTSFSGGIAPQTYLTTGGPYAVGSNRETTIFLSADGGAITANLPTNAVDGRIYIFKKMDNTSNTVTISAPSGGIDSAATYVLSKQYSFVTLQFDGRATYGWYVIAASPTPLPPTPPLPTFNTVVTDYTGGNRGFNVEYQNTGSGPLVVSGTGRTNGSSVGSTQGLIGPSSPPTIQAWGMTGAATISQGVIGFYFTVPSGWYYTVKPNTLSTGSGGGTAVFAVGNWIEEQMYLS